MESRNNSFNAGSMLLPFDEGIDASDEDLELVPFAGEERRGAAFLGAAFLVVADFAMINVFVFVHSFKLSCLQSTIWKFLLYKKQVFNL